ncbi:GAF and ANTAR domain-containing protein [Nocardioides sp. 1609]|uniref:GAF and ANTAR domain-containing protein n=1 Tax=Nocardioides sp. 1609 TaxID=2508327 RepID=UPI001430F77B|nr:GAF and ANTAR domain-containing protein [Nocardioides sp. 1609]
MTQPPDPVPAADVRTLLAEYVTSSAVSIHARLGDVAGVAVSGVDHTGRRAIGTSTALAATIDRIQASIGVGPTFTALEEGRTLHVPDLAAERRWGGYGVVAAEHGAASCIAVPVLAGQRPVAVLEAYASRTGGFGDVQRATAALVARELARAVPIAMDLARHAAVLDDMTALMVNRRVIDLALGILMERAQVTAATAFALLRTQSQRHNVKVHEMARHVIASIPGAAGDDAIPVVAPESVGPGAERHLFE